MFFWVFLLSATDPGARNFIATLENAATEGTTPPTSFYTKTDISSMLMLAFYITSKPNTIPPHTKTHLLFLE
jgi:hypothetical protein